MPELTSAQERELHQDLLELRARLQEALLDEARIEVVDLDLPIGRLSRVDAMQQQAMALEEARRMKRRLQSIEAALERVAEQEYGFCCLSGEPIGYKRLKASPEAPFSVASQTRLERGDA